MSISIDNHLQGLSLFRNMKWWWSLLFCTLLGMITNIYVVYGSINKEEGIRNIKRLFQYAFIISITLHFIILLPQRIKRITQQIIRGENLCLCHKFQYIHGALTPQRKLGWPPGTLMKSPFNNQDIYHAVCIPNWTTFSINQK